MWRDIKAHWGVLAVLVIAAGAVLHAYYSNGAHRAPATANLLTPQQEAAAVNQRLRVAYERDLGNGETIQVLAIPSPADPSDPYLDYHCIIISNETLHSMAVTCPYTGLMSDAGDPNLGANASPPNPY